MTIGDDRARSVDALEERIGHRFTDRALLDQALAHRSWCAEAGGRPSNERLEYLGDAVLGWVVADLAFRRHLDVAEGRLTDLRKSVVSAVTLADVAADVGLGACLLLGRGEDAGGGRAKPSILSDALEAVIGAVYLDGGPEAVFGVVERLLGSRMVGAAPDHKTALQEALARRGDDAPVYTLVEDGPDHDKHFAATVTVGGVVLGEGDGRSKKAAEQRAAESALGALDAGG